VPHPSGEQFTICWEDQEATIVGVGGGLREYEANGSRVLDGYPLGQMCPGARGQPLIPWPNRLRDGRYSFDGEHQLPLTEPDKQNSIHGLVRWSVWSPRLFEAHRLTMGYVLYPQPGYPFLLDLEIAYELSDEGLSVQLTAKNDGERAAPLGAGQHPYLLPPCDRLEDAVLQLPAGCWLTTDGRQIPTGTESVEGTPYDFRAGRAIGATRLDTAYTDLVREADGRCSLLLVGGEHTVRLWLDEQFKYVMAFTGDSLPDPTARRRSLGVEPMSCPPNAFQTREDVVKLEPGGVWRAAWGIEVGSTMR
jgi:aldose 1-epimerase